MHTDHYAETFGETRESQQLTALAKALQPDSLPDAMDYGAPHGAEVVGDAVYCYPPQDCCAPMARLQRAGADHRWCLEIGENKPVTGPRYYPPLNPDYYTWSTLMAHGTLFECLALLFDLFSRDE